MPEGLTLRACIVLFKNPHSTHIVGVVLIVVVLVAIVEVLAPRVVVIVLRRTPIVARRISNFNNSKSSRNAKILAVLKDF